MEAVTSFPETSYTRAAFYTLPCLGTQLIFAFNANHHRDLCAIRLLNERRINSRSRCDLALCPLAETPENDFQTALGSALAIIKQEGLKVTTSLDEMNAVVQKERVRLEQLKEMQEILVR